MPAPIPSRVSPDCSARELSDYRKKLGDELCTHVYYLPGKEFIVAPINGTGLHVEAREVTKIPDSAEHDLLGRVVCDNLLWNVRETPDNMRDRTISDWPAYVASGFKTAKKFQNETIFIGIHTIRLSLNVKARPFNECNYKNRYVGSGTSLSADHDEIGRCIRDVLKGVALLQQADYF